MQTVGHCRLLQIFKRMPVFNSFFAEFLLCQVVTKFKKKLELLKASY